MWYYFTNVCNLISIQPISLYLHMKRDKQFMLSGRKEKSHALTTFQLSWSRFCGKRKQSSLWMRPGRFYIIGNFVLLKGNSTLVFPILGRKKPPSDVFPVYCIILVFLTLPFLPTFSNDYISALLMFINHISPKPSGQFLQIYIEPKVAKHSLFEVSNLFSVPDSALFSS